MLNSSYYTTYTHLFQEGFGNRERKPVSFCSLFNPLSTNGNARLRHSIRHHSALERCNRLSALVSIRFSHVLRVRVLDNHYPQLNDLKD